MKSFESGVIVGIIGSALVAAGSALGYRQTVIKPAEEAEAQQNDGEPDQPARPFILTGNPLDEAEPADGV